MVKHQSRFGAVKKKIGRAFARANVTADEGDIVRSPDYSSGTQEGMSFEPIQLSPAVVPDANITKPISWPSDSTREDEESGGYREVAGASLWFASHAGPEFACKSENQDAAYALVNDNRLIFALTDGVSTSFGARFAALATSRLFCEHLASQLVRGEVQCGQLILAVQSVQTWLDLYLAYLVAAPESGEWAKVRGSSKLAMDVVLQLSENTVNPRTTYWTPVFATTLIGGCVEHVGDHLQVKLIRVGDGAVEKIERSGEVRQVMTMNSQDVKIADVIAPGPRHRLTLAGAECKNTTLVSGEVLLISSDGLMRGHDETLVSKITKLEQGGLGHFVSRDEPRAALDLLIRMATLANKLHVETGNDESYFGDNLSLVAVNCRD